MEPKVIHNEAERRYELWLGDERVGLADYTVRPGEIHFVHTEVNPAHQGKNFAAILMREVLEDVRSTGKAKVVPVCSYVVRYMEKHPDTHDLLLNPIDEAAAACRIPNPDKFAAKHNLELKKD